MADRADSTRGDARARLSNIDQDKLRARMERAVERLLAALDLLDEPTEDMEEDAEGDDPDDEPSLGAPEPDLPYLACTRDADGGSRFFVVNSADQTCWARGGDADLEFGDDNGIADQEGVAEQGFNHGTAFFERVE